VLNFASHQQQPGSVNGVWLLLLLLQASSG
jgi:hypothetical protein